LDVLDLEYLKQARHVIDQLTTKLREVRNVVRTERNEYHLMQEEDQVMDLKVGAVVKKWKQ